MDDDAPTRDLALSTYGSATRADPYALMCGCGDLAEVARTVCEAAARGMKQKLVFTLNDWQPEVLARNLLILHALAFSPADEADLPTLARNIGQLWYSHVLDPKVREFWNFHLRACIAKDWVCGAAAESPLKATDESTQRELRRCWCAWLEIDWSVDKMLEERARYHLSVSAADPSSSPNVSSSVSSFTDRLNAQYRGVLTGAQSARTACSIERLAESSAFTQDSAPVVNPMFLTLAIDNEPYYAVDPNFIRRIFGAFASGNQAVSVRTEAGDCCALIFLDRAVLLPSAGPGMIPTPGVDDDPCNATATRAHRQSRAAAIKKCAQAIAGQLAVRELPAGSITPLSAAALRPLAELVPGTDPRLKPALYASLRPILKRVLIVPAYPVCGSGMDSLGPALKAFLASGI
ncbi:hypothetical protein H9P43_001177 [Blastocladiella emersonii ATCC 22665]|nr:hypothetical protein H9P43_001177 [Blastocladiella emersonii ATCC 22665]